VERIIDGLKAVTQNLGSRLDAAWIEGPFSSGADSRGDPVTVGVVARPDWLREVLDTIREQIVSLETSEDVTVELKGMTRADLAVLSASEMAHLNEYVPLFGPPPMVFTAHGKEYRSLRNAVVHSVRDDEQLELAREIMRRITHDPAKLELAKKYLAQRLNTASDHERHELKEWSSLLDSMSWTRLQHFLASTGERATRLRQTMPFMDVLPPEERQEILAKVRQDDA
jgi:hypothetical protein